MSNTASVIAGLGAGVMLIVVISLLPTNSDDDFDSRFTKYDTRQSIYLDTSSVENEEGLQTMNKLLNAFDSCDYQLVQISYGLGSMRAAIEGMQNGFCSMAVEYEIEQGGEKLDCLVPQGRLASWMPWTNRVMPTVDEIKPYCDKVGDIRPLE